MKEKRKDRILHGSPNVKRPCRTGAHPIAEATLPERPRQVRASGGRAIPLAKLLERLLEDLTELQAPEVRDLAHEVESSLELFQNLEHRARLLSERVLAPLHPSLFHIRACMREGKFDARLHRDLQTATRRLGCVLRHAAEAPDDSDFRAEHLSVNYASTDVADLVRSACDPFKELAERRGIQFEIATPETLQVEIDPNHLQFALVALLFNAIKHAPVGGRIACHLLCSRDDEVDLHVADDGPAIALHQREAVFHPQRQTDRAVFPMVEGVRLSLSAARDRLSLLGGTLNLGPSRGCLFRMTFPCTAPGELRVSQDRFRSRDLPRKVVTIAARELDAEARITNGSVEPQGPPVIVVVDDSRAVQRVIASVLEPDYKTISALDGVHGLRQATTLRPALLIADLALPGLGGEGVIRGLRARRDFSNTPVLVLTGSADPACVVRLLENGVDEVLRKPFLPAELRVRVDKLLETARTRRILEETSGDYDSDLLQLAREVAQYQKRLRRALEDARVARESAEVASRIKSNFLRMMSHELKTPITAMRLDIWLLHREEHLSTQARDSLRRLSRAKRQLLYVLDSILEWGRCNGGETRLAVAPFDASTLVDEVIEELRKTVASEGVQLVRRTTTNKEPSLTSDPRIVRLLLVNVITHALQRTSEGQVEVAVQVDHDGHSISVTDQGPPLTDGERHQLLSPLETDRDLRSEAGAGSGLGLYLVRNLAKAVDGHLSLVGTNTSLLKLPCLPEGRTTSRICVDEITLATLPSSD